MANETRGILFEAITEAALQQAVKLAGILGIVRWNKKPEGMTINPDFTIGINKDSPSHVVLVTASGAARNADMKSWRNLGEMQEVKAQLPFAPITVNLYFISEIKLGLAALGESLYDATLHVDQRPYYFELATWVNENLEIDTKTKEAKQALLASDAKANPQLTSAITSLAQDLAQALQQRKTELDPLWVLMRVDYAKPHNPPNAKNTFVRRGLGKLLVLDPYIRQLVYAGYDKRSSIRIDNLPEYAFELGFFKKSLAGAHVADPEINGVLELLGGATCETVLQHAPSSMNTWISPLRDLGRVATHADFIHQHYDQITDPNGLRTLLTQCFNDPADLSGESGDEKVWIYEIMISLLKAKSGRLQGYGLAQLAVDTEVPEFGAGGFIIPPFIQREKMLTPDHLRMLAQGLANRFKTNVSRNDVLALKVKVEKWVIKENLEDRLIPYRNFEPLLWLLMAELREQGKSYRAKVPYEGWVNEYAAVGKKSATTPFVKVGTTLIHWKSVSDAGKVHKKKELAARARSVKYQYHSVTKTFTRRAGVEQLALIVDGTFTNDDLKILSESGWDIIVYPDEISTLVSHL